MSSEQSDLTSSFRVVIYSGQSRPPTEKGTREEPRADNGADRATRATDLLDRGREHQPRDSPGDEAGRYGNVADPRWNEPRKGRPDDVCGWRAPLDLYEVAFTDCAAGTYFENNTSSARRSGKRLPAFRLANSRTRTSWIRNWRDWSRRLWTSGCSIRALCRSIPSWTGYRRLASRSVS